MGGSVGRMASKEISEYVYLGGESVEDNNVADCGVDGFSSWPTARRGRPTCSMAGGSCGASESVELMTRVKVSHQCEVISCTYILYYHYPLRSTPITEIRSSPITETVAIDTASWSSPLATLMTFLSH